ncbi:MAG: hypothetical protein COA79_03595 [Planctomycetota bacterium]|nr:MAG: hypothetical protein COA79_03595 [Planctomycetota bacterium]
MKNIFKLSSCFLAICFVMVSSLAAQDADVKVYGRIHASINFISQDKAESGLHVSSQSSRFGVKGTYDASDAITAMFQIEIQTDISDNSKSSADFLKSRNSYLGIKGDSWGSLLIGRHDTPYKKAAMKSDFFNDTIADYDGIIGRSSSGKKAHFRADNIILYKSPKLIDGALTASLAFLPSDTVFDTTDTNTDGDQDDDAMGVSANAVYQNKDMGLSLSLGLHYDTGGLKLSSTDEPAFGARLIGGYNFLEQHQLWLIIEILDGGDTKSTSRPAFNLGYKFTFDKNSVRANLSFALESDADAKDEATQFSIGFFHTFSSTFEMYAIATYLAGGDGSTYSITTNDGYTLTPTGGDSDTIFGFALGATFTF